MEYRTETLDTKQKMLIVAKQILPFINIIKKELIKYQVEIFYSSKLPKNINDFDYCFLVNPEETVKKLSIFKKAAFIFINQPQKANKLFKNRIKDIKIINIIGDIVNRQQVDNILWFVFSQSKESYLKLNVPFRTQTTQVLTPKKLFDLKKIISKKNTIALIISIIIIIHISFIPFLILSSWFIYKTAVFLKNENIVNSQKYLSLADKSQAIMKKLYPLARPTLLLFSLALIPDNIIDINEKSGNILKQTIIISQNSKEIFRLILKKEKTPQEKALISLRLVRLNSTIEQVEDNLQLLSQKIPPQIKYFQKLKQELIDTEEIIIKSKKILPHLDNIFAKNTNKKYLLLFANNRELRPGGGFIGSFGILSIADYTIEDLKIYDVYDADGQLIAHIEPPSPIKQYLEQPHWFLRDSAFSPDFLENYAQAKFFLEKEINLKDLSGAILITTSTIENILEAFGNIYVPDFNESINSKNFYLKTQINSDKNFFPGSIQKKSFLASLTRQILINLENVSVKKLVSQVKKSLDEKQMIVFFDSTEVQNTIDELYWSGRVIQPRCNVNSGNCIIDYIFPYDANLGVNKANFFISRHINLKITVDKEGNITHLLTFRFKNDSMADVFPGGNYKNYFQLLLPTNVKIKFIAKDDTLIEGYDENNDLFKKIGFVFDVLPKKTTVIKINYSLMDTFKKGKSIYQLILQKQIGSSNNDISLEINLPKNLYLLNQNFTPLVKDHSIIYNTSLSADKIFFMELIKD